MSQNLEPTETELLIGAYIDGEMDPAERAAFAARLASDPALAALLAQYQSDQDRLAALFAPIAARPLPAAWRARIEAATQPRRAPRLAMVSLALAAAIAIALTGAWRAGVLSPPETILAQADAARGGSLAPTQQWRGAGLPIGAARDQLLAANLHLPVHAPDLSRFGYQLAELDVYAPERGQPALGMRYRQADGRELTIYVRAAIGAPRFDMLRDGNLRRCVWQDDVVGAVMTGEMTAGQMMRLASAAYSDLDL